MKHNKLCHLFWHCLVPVKHNCRRVRGEVLSSNRFRWLHVGAWANQPIHFDQLFCASDWAHAVSVFVRSPTPRTAARRPCSMSTTSYSSRTCMWPRVCSVRTAVANLRKPQVPLVVLAGSRSRQPGTLHRRARVHQLERLVLCRFLSDHAV